MRTLFLISAAAIGLTFAVPASAMPITGHGLSAKSEVTVVRMKKRHHMRAMRRGGRNDLSTGLPGRGTDRDMSKTNGGRANDR
jgi:hypothetical protein